MLDGDFERAWRISDRVLRRRAGHDCADLPLHLRWVWNGSPFDDRHVLIRCYHGLGDTLHFIRFVPAVTQRARRISVEAQPALLPLLRSMRDIDTLLPLGSVFSGVEVDIESMELPHALRVTANTIPSTVPYLAPPNRAVDRAAQRLARIPHPRIGVVWAAGDWRRERSLPAALLAPLTRLPVALISLQHGAARQALDPGLARWFSAEIAPDSSVADLAGLMHGLDLIVTVDTMAAHLAGAMGRPVWLLLDADADWRWMRGRRDSPWYPTMRLFRQSRQGSWQPVVEQVAGGIAALVKASARNEGFARFVLKATAFL